MLASSSYSRAGPLFLQLLAASGVEVLSFHHLCRVLSSLAGGHGSYRSRLQLQHALQSAQRCISSLPGFSKQESSSCQHMASRVAAATAQPLQDWNSSNSSSWLCHIGSSTAQILQQQQQQHLSWGGVRQYSQSTTAAAAPADPQHQQQEQQSASEAATSSFINAPSATAAAGTPAATAGAASAAAAAAASVGGVLAGGAAGELKDYSMRQVSKHASDETCWIVVNGKVRAAAAAAAAQLLLLLPPLWPGSGWCVITCVIVRSACRHMLSWLHADCICWLNEC
jgi:hypothetical protein